MVKKISAKKNYLAAFFIIAFGFSWFFWSFDVLSSFHVITLPFSYMILFIVGAHGPLVAALIMTYKLGGWRAVKDLLRSGFSLRMPLTWWLVILALPVILGGLTWWINGSINDFQFDATLLMQPILILPTFIAMFFFGGSFQEEFGWRGFALPRLLEKWNPLVASLILGGLWGIWHLPLFFIAGTGQSFMPLGIFLIMTLAFSILFTWIFLRTRRNVFGALLFHTALNTTFSLFPPIVQMTGGNQVGLTYLMIAYALVALIVVIKERVLFFKATVE